MNPAHESHLAPDQAVPQSIASPGEAAADGADGPVKLGGGTVVRHPFEVTENDGQPVLRRQAIDLLMKDGKVFSLLDGAGGLPAGRVVKQPTRPVASLDSQSDAVRNPVKPRCQASRPPYRSSPPDQHQKCRLKGIFGIIGVGQDLLADGEHQGAMASHDRLERTAISLAYESLKQFLLAQANQGPRAEESFNRAGHEAPTFAHDSLVSTATLP